MRSRRLLAALLAAFALLVVLPTIIYLLYANRIHEETLQMIYDTTYSIEPSADSVLDFLQTQESTTDVTLYGFSTTEDSTGNQLLGIYYQDASKCDCFLLLRECSEYKGRFQKALSSTSSMPYIKVSFSSGEFGNLLAICVDNSRLHADHFTYFLGDTSQTVSLDKPLYTQLFFTTPDIPLTFGAFFDSYGNNIPGK